MSASCTSLSLHQVYEKGKEFRGHLSQNAQYYKIQWVINLQNKLPTLISKRNEISIPIK